MKNLKKQLVILYAMSAVMISSAVSVFAAPSATVRPMPGSQSGSTVTSSGMSASDEAGVSNNKGSLSDSSDSSNSASSSSSSGSSDNGNYKASDSSEGVTRDVPTAIPVTDNGQVNIVTDTEKAPKSKGSVSVGAMIVWLLLSVIINSAISFWIANRFYRLSKKDSHVTAEIRALRRDVEEKFLQSVGGFTEQAIDVNNTNEDYSMTEEGITMPRHRRAEKVVSDNDEMLRQWESRMNTRDRARRKYQPTREEIEPKFEEYDEEESSKSPIKNKAKELLNDIFPFKED